MHWRTASGEPPGGIRYCHMKERNTKRIEEVLNNFIDSMCGKITETAQKSDRRHYTCDVASGANTPGISRRVPAATEILATRSLSESMGIS
ncbi:hypothetical protein AVEN_143222-1 [Araneus ventricosus]|uniref:Uncharacterized protein n=1 Tax=Araneus ventricosus TaxID=182803 RepID=A0A4Y2AF67_ARAVE|nr:hypothetical protein AVEN_143222-1 [Araneus ventricosus]